MLKPVLREYFSVNPEEDDREALIINTVFKRMILVELVSRNSDDLGFGRTHEGTEAGDTYNIIIKAGNIKDAENIFLQMREICIMNEKCGEYNRIEVPNPVYTTQRGKWITNLEVICYRSGKVRKDGAF